MIRAGDCVDVIIVTGTRVCVYVYVFICTVFWFVVVVVVVGTIITIGVSGKSQQLQISKGRNSGKTWEEQHRLPEKDGAGGYCQHNTVRPVSKTSCGHCCWCG